MDRYFRTTAKGAFTSIFSFGLRKRPVRSRRRSFIVGKSTLSLGKETALSPCAGALRKKSLGRYKAF
jgi:hypothetical protein